MSTTFKSGGATVTLSGDLQKWADEAIINATKGAVTVLQAELQAVASNAAATWYGPDGVKRDTGLSGQMSTTTTIDLDRGTATVSVGSTDPRRWGSAPIAAIVHRKGEKSQLLRQMVNTPAKLAIGRAIPRIAAAMRAGVEVTRAK